MCAISTFSEKLADPIVIASPLVLSELLPSSDPALAHPTSEIAIAAAVATKSVFFIEIPFWGTLKFATSDR